MVTFVACELFSNSLNGKGDTPFRLVVLPTEDKLFNIYMEVNNYEQCLAAVLARLRNQKID